MRSQPGIGCDAVCRALYAELTMNLPSVPLRIMIFQHPFQFMKKYLWHPHEDLLVLVGNVCFIDHIHASFCNSNLILKQTVTGRVQFKKLSVWRICYVETSL